MRDDTSIAVAAAGQFDWNLVEQIMEPELGALMQSAHEAGALIRCRGVKSASVLLRLILAYACGDASLRRVGCWAARQDLCDLSAVAISLRLRTAVRWLGCLLARFMVRRRLSLPHLNLMAGFVFVSSTPRRRAARAAKVPIGGFT